MTEVVQKWVECGWESFCKSEGLSSFMKTHCAEDCLDKERKNSADSEKEPTEDNKNDFILEKEEKEKEDNEKEKDEEDKDENCSNTDESIDKIDEDEGICESLPEIESELIDSTDLMEEFEEIVEKGEEEELYDIIGEHSLGGMTANSGENSAKEIDGSMVNKMLEDSDEDMEDEIHNYFDDGKVKDMDEMIEKEVSDVTDEDNENEDCLADETVKQLPENNENIDEREDLSNKNEKLKDDTLRNGNPMVFLETDMVYETLEGTADIGGGLEYRTHRKKSCKKTRTKRRSRRDAKKNPNTESKYICDYMITTIIIIIKCCVDICMHVLILLHFC